MPSMRLELTRVCSLNDLQLVMSLYRDHPLFFLPYMFFDEYICSQVPYMFSYENNKLEAYTYIRTK